MADPTSKLADWLADNAEALNLQVKRLHWLADWKLGQYTDIEVSIEIDRRVFIGRGTALGEELAFVKAGAEAIERAYCGAHRIHTLGVAAHTSVEAAKENTLSEINERDAFFCHFYTKTPFLPLPDSSLAGPESSFGGVFDKARAHGIDLRFFRAISYGHPVFLCAASGQKATPEWGGIVGLGSNANEGQAIVSALFECLRNLSGVVENGPPQTLTKKEFVQIENPTSRDRQLLAMNLDYWKKISLLFPERLQESPASLPKVTTAALPWTIENLECPLPVLRAAPIVVCRAKLDESCGDVLFRENDRSPTTLRRLSEFIGQPVQYENLESKPHFLG